MKGGAATPKQRAQWRITDASGAQAPAEPKKVMAHLKELPITDDMSEGTRNFAEQYNSMRAVLIENKLMKAKSPTS